ncbi:MAG: ferrous iron transport protein A [Succiniclasticum sp.]|jgi:ferrous iron transport protein A|uniref:Ferrous iron transport protein A n=2 Tax=Succiniclasticum ruminis TaxID=40841 RepID=A0A1I2AGB6_9FIRM|nr:ferrous iron transport protein A [Succiniclasticum ruminis]MBQ3367213.1 ferrous iron transport protein A [Acidaminococcaceae bacterium]MEE3454952.1 ferrous iron transport protein A [Succiniclasticum sp.]MBQ6744558.1 ferrous iron transport protein A [Acidaminococcaceae bacterium]MBQ6913771.1 ferrous iron transport protein A [Acidaminococcaceae bacterium]MBQ8700980.1 ferrous iron transport protein A [Acidaminococcaceae bacterium]
MTLNEIPVGGVCTVTKLNGTGKLRRRIMDMGITKGVEIKVVKIAPLGDPMELNVRGYELSIRKSEAESIEVQ